MNDWYDREIDAINEPYRPIPSGEHRVQEFVFHFLLEGAIPERDVIIQIWVLLLGGFAVACGLDAWSNHDFPSILSITIFGAIISYIYSAPPLKLKQFGWIGNYALGSSYIALPWWAGQVSPPFQNMGKRFFTGGFWNAFIGCDHFHDALFNRWIGSCNCERFQKH